MTRMPFIPSLRTPLRARTQLTLLASVVFALCIGASPSPSNARSAPTKAAAPQKVPDGVEHSPDAYAIYSLLMPGEALAKMDRSQNQRWAIAATTVNAHDINPALAPEAALKAPETSAKNFREAVGDYDARKNERLQLTRSFHLDRPYVLLTPEEVAEFQTARTSPSASSSLRQKYDGYPGITYFSPVFFNADQTAALVYMVNWCGNLCAGGEWVYLEKQGGRWIRRSGAH